MLLRALILAGYGDKIVSLAIEEKKRTGMAVVEVNGKKDILTYDSSKGMWTSRRKDLRKHMQEIANVV